MKKTFLKCISCIIVTLMLVYMVPLIGVQAQASVSYDRNAAVNYAAKHWNDGVGQCAEFVSACLSAGGLSVSQKVCLNLWNTLKKYGTPYKLTATSSGNGNIKLSSNKGKVEAGDPLFYVCETCGGTSGNSAFPHVVICSGTDSSGYLTAYGHNAAWNNKKVWTQFSAGAHSTHKTNIYSIHIESGNTDSYTLTYDANGGTGAPSAQKFSASSSFVKISSVEPTRTGYQFAGWLTTPNKPSGVPLVYGAGTNQPNFGKNITLYAYWTHNYYTVKYNANGGSGSMSSTSHDYDIAKMLSKNTFKRLGYSFVGWSKSSSATSATYTDGQSVKNLTATNGATINLYAVWKKNPTYTLTYNANGGSDAPPSQSGSASYTVSSSKPTRSGYTFLGWATSSSATSASYTAGDKINLIANTTLYAVWKKNPTYTLTYNANGGQNPPSSQSGSTSYTISSTKPTRSGYTFLGWATSSSATSASYTAGDKINLTANTTLYAVWQKKTYILAYYANGGVGVPTMQNNSTSYTVSSTKPTRSGYTFLGWATSSSATSASYTAGDQINLSADTSLYAVWKKETYTLTYSANGGTGEPPIQSGSTNYIVSSIKPTRSGYTFLGWATSNSASFAGYTSGDKITLVSDLTLYAVWKKNVTIKQTEIVISSERDEMTGIYYVSENETVNVENGANETGIGLSAEFEYNTEDYETEVSVEAEIKSTTANKENAPDSDNNNTVKITGMICATALIAIIAGFVILKKRKD